MSTEADACRKYVLPRLYAAGWDDDRIAERRTFTDGRTVVTGNRARRRPGKRADYILRYRANMPIAVVEAKPTYKSPGNGTQQAKDCAEILGLKFAYSTNGTGIVEFDYLTGRERELDAFPSPDELWSCLTAAQGLTPDAPERSLTPAHRRPRCGGTSNSGMPTSAARSRPSVRFAEPLPRPETGWEQAATRIPVACRARAMLTERIPGDGKKGSVRRE